MVPTKLTLSASPKAYYFAQRFMYSLTIINYYSIKKEESTHIILVDKHERKTYNKVRK